MNALTRMRRAVGNAAGRFAGKIGGFSGPMYFYEGSQYWSKDRSFMLPHVADSRDTLDAWTRHTLLALARNLYVNVGFVKGAIDDISRYSVGQGIFPHSAALDRGIAEAYDAYFEQWSGICEVRQLFNFPTILKLTSRAIDVDGDVGFILTENDSGYPQIQAIESHRIDSEGDIPGYFDGVKLDSVNRPMAYRIKTRTADGDIYTSVQASDFVHVFESERFDGIRGVSALKHALNHIRDRKDIIAFEKLGVKNASAIANVITVNSLNTTANGFFGGQQQSTDSSGKTVTWEALRGGAIPRLLQGEKLESFSSNRPSPTFTGFLDYIDRDVSVGLGIPLEFIWDSSNLGGTAQRFVLQKAQRRFEERQETLKLMTLRIRNWVIAKGIKRGDIPESQDWWKVHFQLPRMITVDVGKEATANREDVWSGLRTIQEDYAERGIQWIKARQDMQTAADDLLERAVQLVAKYKNDGLSLERAIALMEERSSRGSAPAITIPPVGPESAPPGKKAPTTPQTTPSKP